MKSRIALLSVTNKAGVVDVARFLVKSGFSIVATKNTCSVLSEAGIASQEVSEFTGHDEILGGRVKTLHPKIFAGILSDRERHSAETSHLGIPDVDVVVANLYPFSDFAVRLGTSESEVIEKIDIGGVSLLRAGAKNFRYVTVISDPSDYNGFVEEMERNGGVTTVEYRRRMAAKAYAVTTAYDAHINRWLCGEELFPEEIIICGKKIQNLRIGENPHQKAALYTIGRSTRVPIEQLHGKELSYNNIVDIESSLKIVREFEVPAVSVIKHGNPCGVAISGVDINDAYDKALSCDPRSSFGGIIALNRPMTAEIARKLVTVFIEAVVAPDFDEEVLDILGAKGKLRILKHIPYGNSGLMCKSTFDCGLLVQERDDSAVVIDDFMLVTDVSASKEMLEDLLFAWRVCKHVRSNAVVIAREGMAIGVGAGQMSRVDSVEIGIRKAGNCARAVMASDAFFPFSDSLQHAVSAGIVAIVQPGGSIRDQEVIDAANLSKIPMYFTGFRSFCH
ncbi:MAG: bifunctional phosphoribosylaminoimidazolecarboxamide formyltransferase/IMP cyclohydrolase [Aaplasma endosymbiont of Hyalomma asiaticum]